MRIFFLISTTFLFLSNCYNFKNEKIYVPDISVNDIKLSDISTKVSGYENFRYKIIEDSISLPYVVFSNKNKTEMLKLSLFYGTNINEFYQIEISKYYDGTEANPTHYEKFYTESGIKLGISKKDLINLKGTNFVEKDNIVRYEISDYQDSEFLQKYNLPLYFAEYSFNKEEKLYKIYFGFEYP